MPLFMVDIRAGAKVSESVWMNKIKYSEGAGGRPLLFRIRINPPVPHACWLVVSDDGCLRKAYETFLFEISKAQ